MTTERKALTYVDGKWLEGNPPLMGPLTHSTWMASLVFDGARSFEGTAPDLDLHCARVIHSARSMHLKPAHRAEEIEEIAREGIAKFSSDTALYIRPMYWADEGFVAPDPDSTRFALTVQATPMPPAQGFGICKSSYRRPAVDMAPTNAKAACLYPNSVRALFEAKERGFDNAVVSDPNGNVAELATANLFYVRDGEVHTPAENGTFLAGITRNRVIALLREAGFAVHTRSFGFQELMHADEIFSTGNYGKVQPVSRIEDRELQPGPVYQRARDLYWVYAHSNASL